jgi:hypothetical protein
LLVLAVILLSPGMASAAAPRLPAGWTHISINVIIHKVPHTLVYDRGRVIAVTASSLTLRESDGSVWVINVSPTAELTIDGEPAALAQVRRLETATTLSIDGGPATKVTVRIPLGLAARIARESRG